MGVKIIFLIQIVSFKIVPAVKTKDDDKFFGNLNILTIIFVNTNDLRKKHPDFKLSYIDPKTKTMKKKPHSPNKIWFAIFDKNGRDYLSPKDFSNSAFMKQMKKISSEIYNYDDYSNSSDDFLFRFTK